MDTINNAPTPHIVATMTTIPSRIALIEPVIKSVLSQTVLVSHVEINIPVTCKRTGEVYVIPRWLTKHPKVHVHRTEDYGPITKVGPTLLRYASDTETYLWSVDDDFDYPSTHLALVMVPFDPTKKEILSRYGGKLTSDGTIQPWTGTSYVDYFEGFGSVLYPPNCIRDNFETYLVTSSKNERCRRADDIVLSMYFKHVGVPMKLNNTPTDDTPYLHLLESALPQGQIQALSAQGHVDNYKVVYKYIRALLDSGCI